MEVYTGQFSKMSQYLAAGLVVCSIARWDPKDYTGCVLKELAPSEELLKGYQAGQISIAEFTLKFKDQLEQLDSLEIRAKLEIMSGDSKGIVLCCYEPMTQFCHRHLVASYLTVVLGQSVSEFV